MFKPTAENLKVFNAAQEIADWAEQNFECEDWVIGNIASKKAYDNALRENMLLKERLHKLKQIINE